MGLLIFYIKYTVPPVMKKSYNHVPMYESFFVFVCFENSVKRSGMLCFCVFIFFRKNWRLSGRQPFYREDFWIQCLPVTGWLGIYPVWWITSTPGISNPMLNKKSPLPPWRAWCLSPGRISTGIYPYSPCPLMSPHSILLSCPSAKLSVFSREWLWTQSTILWSQF